MLPLFVNVVVVAALDVAVLPIQQSHSERAAATMDSPAKHSRFSTLNVFGKFSSAGSKPPPPPPKDEWYLQQSSKSALSLNTIHTSTPRVVEPLKVPPLPQNYASRSQSDLSRSMSPTISVRSRSTSNTHGSPPFIPSRVPETPKFFSKLSNSFSKRPKLFLRSNSSRTTLSQDSHHSHEARPTEDGVMVIGCPDEISRPVNVKVRCRHLWSFLSYFLLTRTFFSTNYMSMKGKTFFLSV